MIAKEIRGVARVSLVPQKASMSTRALAPEVAFATGFARTAMRIQNLTDSIKIRSPRRRPRRRHRPAIRRARRARDVHLHRAALRPAEPRPLLQRRPPLVEQNGSNLRRHSLPPGSAGSRPMLWHRRHDAGLAPPGREVLRENSGRRLFPRHAAAGQPKGRCPRPCAG